MLVFNKIVQRLGTKGGKIFMKNDIFELIDPEKKEKYQNYVDKTIYKLKVQGVIIPLKSGIYIVPSEEDKKLNKIDLLDKYFFQLLKKYITYHVGSSYYISGKKALEVHLKNYEVPEKILIVNRAINKKIKCGSYEIIFKTISGKRDGKKVNLYTHFSQYVLKKEIEGFDFKIANLELSLVESALVLGEEGVSIDILNKTIKKYGDILNEDIFYDIGSVKYIMSFNRLKEIAKPIHKKLYTVFLDIIKKNGGLFIGEGLRGF